MNFIVPPLTFIESSVCESLTTFPMPVMINPFTNIVRSVWLDLTTKTLHLIVFELTFIQETELIELDTVTVSFTFKISLAFVLGLIIESYSWSYFSLSIVFY